MRHALIACLIVLGGCQATPPAEPQVPVPAFKDALAQDAYVVATLKARKYEELDRVLRSIQQAYEKDPLLEAQAGVAWGAFARTGAGLGPLLDEWVDRMPDSYAARLARSRYLYSMGWSARGGRFASQTSSRQFKEMREHFARALADSDAALAANPRALHAVVLKMGIATAQGPRESVRTLYDQALALNPLSYTARRWYLDALAPRWGGSHAEMEALVAAARPLYEKYPRLRWLETAIPSDIALSAINGPNPIQPFLVTTRALELHGDEPLLLRYNAEAHVRMSQFPQALQALDKAIAADPTLQRSHYLRGFSRMQQRDMAGAIAEFTAELELNHADHKTLDTRGAARANLGDLKGALADFEAALAMDPENAEYQDDVRRAKRMLGLPLR